MRITFTKTIQIKSKFLSILFFSIFIIAGIAVMVFFSMYKETFKSKYYYVQGVVESCELEDGFGGTNYVHSITYSLKDHEYVWEYVDNVPKFYKGEKVNLKVNKEELGDVQLDLKTSTEKKLESKIIDIIPMIIGIAFVAVGALGVIFTIKRKNVQPINVSFGR